MTTATGTIDDYMLRLRDLAGSRDHIDRFYLFMEDDQLVDLEYDLANGDQAGAFYDALLEQYRAWKNAMRPEEWAEVVAHNNLMNGANQNALIDEI